MVLFNHSLFACVSHILCIVLIAETNLIGVWEGFATHAMTWPSICEEFCRTKKYNMFKTFANYRDQIAMHPRFAIPCERFGTVREFWQIHLQTNPELAASQ